MEKGYDPHFISDKIRVPLPSFGRTLGRSAIRRPGVLRDDLYSDHIHFTIVMNEHTRQPIYVASNIDQTKFVPNKNKIHGEHFGERSWRTDRNFERADQLENEYYKDRKSASGETIPNPYDKGHMAMRWNNMWGNSPEEADKAGKATFLYSNASLQHGNLNRDEWRALESNIVREFQDDANDKLSVISGPIFGDLDRHIHISSEKSARAPSGFFKVVCFQSKFDERDDQLGVLAFAIFQDPTILRDQKGSATVKTDRRYQVTIKELQDLTDINFGKKLFDANPLFYYDNPERQTEKKVFQFPERIPFDRSSELVARAAEVRDPVGALAERPVVINSAMINPTSRQQSGEWVSLHNRGGGRISLKKWSLTDKMGRRTELDGSINSGDSLRVTGRALEPVKLPNRGGSLMLHDDEGRLIDHVNWTKNDLKRIEHGMAYMFERGQ